MGSRAGDNRVSQRPVACFIPEAKADKVLSVRSKLEESVWISVESCPACEEQDTLELGKLALEEYQFGEERIPLPPEGIRLSECRNCGLVFKNTLPSPSFLAEVFGRQKGKVWAGDYDFSDEADLIREFLGNGKFDLLDIGASNGGLLKAFSKSGGRRSALDIVKHPGLEEWIRGEFIHGLAESGELSWSNEPYDVVGMFDIIEHFYDPQKAFINLRLLVKPEGFVIVETGDVHSRWPRKFGVHKWWYACLFPHHMFWTRSSIERLAVHHGFEVVEARRKQHKEQTAKRFTGELLYPAEILQVLKSLMYEGAPESYKKLQELVGKPGVPPRNVLSRDHFQLVLRAKT